MTTLTTEELLRLAKRVYPPTDKDSWCIFDGIVGRTYNTDEHGWIVCAAGLEFNPSLTGEDWQKAQALSVIVEAFGLGFGVCVWRGFGSSNNFLIKVVHSMKKEDTFSAPDLLSAAARAILQEGE